MTQAPPATPPRPRRWPRVLLIASLALNALLIGVVIRGLWIARTNFAFAGAAIETSLPAFVKSLPEQRREELRRAKLPDRSAALRPLRMEMRRARMETVRIFLAEPYDREAFIAAQNRMFEAENNLRRAIQSFLPEVGDQLTASERRALLRWHRPPGRGGEQRGRMREEREEPSRPPQRNL